MMIIERRWRSGKFSTVNISNMCDVDPLAQTFLVTTKGGAFITKVDLYFAAKIISSCMG